MKEIDSEPLLKELIRIRRLKRVFWTISLTYAPVAAILGMLTGSKQILILVTLIWVSFGLFVGLLVTFTRCPRCDKLFNLSLTWSNPWARRCLHCGLKLKEIDIIIRRNQETESTDSM